MVRFGGFTQYVVVNPLKTNFEEKSADHYYQKYLTAAICVLIFIKKICKRITLNFLASVL